MSITILTSCTAKQITGLWAGVIEISLPHQQHISAINATMSINGRCQRHWTTQYSIRMAYNFYGITE